MFFTQQSGIDFFTLLDPFKGLESAQRTNNEVIWSKWFEVSNARYLLTRIQSLHGNLNHSATTRSLKVSYIPIILPIINAKLTQVFKNFCGLLKVWDEGVYIKIMRSFLYNLVFLIAFWDKKTVLLLELN